jgi:hypothetical protein
LDAVATQVPKYAVLIAHAGFAYVTVSFWIVFLATPVIHTVDESSNLRPASGSRLREIVGELVHAAHYA